MQRIAMVLTASTRNISGGYKIVYEYANRLSLLGYKIDIIYNCSDDKKKTKNMIFRLLIRLYREYLSKIEPQWFCLDSCIKKRVVNSLKKELDYDIVILCGSYNVLEYYLYHDNKTISLIQDYENWQLSDQEVSESFQKNTVNIAVSQWLKSRVMEISKEKCIYISNPIDLSKFYIETPIEKRELQISMLYHKQERKGTIYGLEVIKILHKRYPNIKFTLFGFPKRTDDIPSWIEYYQNANNDCLRKIYNRSIIFLCPSLVEGYGLTGAESMACGCALVSTETLGVFDYAEHGINSMLSPPKDVEGMINNVALLIENPVLRIKIAYAGVESIKGKSWEKAVKQFNEVINNF